MGQLKFSFSARSRMPSTRSGALLAHFLAVVQHVHFGIFLPARAQIRGKYEKMVDSYTVGCAKLGEPRKWAECGTQGIRYYTVKCMGNIGMSSAPADTIGVWFDDNKWEVVPNDLCSAHEPSKPSTQESCTMNCYYVSPELGSDLNSGQSLGDAFQTIQKCVDQADVYGTSTSSSRNLQFTNCKLAAGFYDQALHGAVVEDRQNLAIQSDSTIAILDGTRNVTQELVWSLVNTTSAAGNNKAYYEADVSALVDGTNVTNNIASFVFMAESMQCATGDSSGGHGLAHSSVPCVVYDPMHVGHQDTQRITGPKVDANGTVQTVNHYSPLGYGRTFGKNLPTKYFSTLASNAEATLDTSTSTWWWYDTASKKLFYAASGAPHALSVQHNYVNRDGWPPHVRVKDQSKAWPINLKQRNTYIWIEGLHFFGTNCCSKSQPLVGNKFNLNIYLLYNHFLYSPPHSSWATVQIFTTKQNGRGSGKRLFIADNAIVAGATKRAVRYKASNAFVSRNYVAFNGYAHRKNTDGYEYCFQGDGFKDTLQQNTLLYNGHGGGFKHWARGYQCKNNLIVGTGYMGSWKDTASFHIQIDGQYWTLISGNFIFGPTKIKSIRLDTSSTATNPGRFTTVVRNVLFGNDPFTVKGDNHTIVNNMGSDEFNLVKSWGAIRNHNGFTATKYNAFDKIASRGSALKLPGSENRLEYNLCDSKTRCNRDAVASSNVQYGSTVGFCNEVSASTCAELPANIRSRSAKSAVFGSGKPVPTGMPWFPAATLDMKYKGNSKMHQATAAIANNTSASKFVGAFNPTSLDDTNRRVAMPGVHARELSRRFCSFMQPGLFSVGKMNYTHSSRYSVFRADRLWCHFAQFDTDPAGSFDMKLELLIQSDVASLSSTVKSALVSALSRTVSRALGLSSSAVTIDASKLNYTDAAGTAAVSTARMLLADPDLEEALQVFEMEQRNNKAASSSWVSSSAASEQGLLLRLLQAGSNGTQKLIQADATVTPPTGSSMGSSASDSAPPQSPDELMEQVADPGFGNLLVDYFGQESQADSTLSSASLVLAVNGLASKPALSNVAGGAAAEGGANWQNPSVQGSGWDSVPSAVANAGTQGSPQSSGAATGGTAAEEKKDDEGDSLTWLWILIGVLFGLCFCAGVAFAAMCYFCKESMAKFYGGDNKKVSPAAGKDAEKGTEMTSP